MLTVDLKKLIVNNKQDTKAKPETVFKAYLRESKKHLRGLPLTYCFKDLYCHYIGTRDATHTRSQHAEERALEKCNRSRTLGGTMYSTSLSCELCSKKALHYGISRIVYIEPYVGISESHILGQSGRGGQITMELFTGACNMAYVKLYTPIFPAKDELAFRGFNLLKPYQIPLNKKDDEEENSINEAR